MRTIKFRGKNKKGEWLYGDLLHWHGVYEDPWIQIGVEKLFDQVTAKGGSVVPETVGQFVGLHDKNGKEIYEGDIVRSDDYPFSDLNDNERDNYMGVVFCVTGEDDSIGEFQVMQFVTKKSTRSGISNFINKSFYDINMDNLEVIGNIFDNKGLFRDSDDEILQWYKDEDS